MSLRHRILMLLVAGITACTTARPVGHARLGALPQAAVEIPEHADGAEDAPTATDDVSRIRRLEQVATDLIDRGVVTPLDVLREQLDRPRCDLSLLRPPRRRLSPRQIYDRRNASVLVVAGIYMCDRCKRWHAGATSGFLVTASGAFVTNYHVINEGKNHTFLAMTHDGRVFPVKEVLAASKEADVAILQLDAPGIRFEPVALSTNAPVGALVTVISHPNRRFYTLTDGMVSRYDSRTTNGRTIRRMTVTADFARGSSGGPVFNEYGAVVGLVGSTVSVYYRVEDGKQENLQMVFKQCVPAESVLDLLGD